MAISAVTGLVSLTLLTHLYPVRAVGLSAAAISATSLIGAISQLGLNYSLVRFLPTSKWRAELINSVLTATMLVAICAAGVFLLLPAAAKLYALGGIAFAAVFLISCAFSAGIPQLTNVFVADRAAGDTVRPNLIGSVANLAGPPLLLFVGIMGAYLAQGVIPAAVDFLILAYMLAKRGHKFRPALSKRATKDLRKFSLGTYIAGLIGGVPLIVLPLVILARFGPTQNAYWYSAMAGAALLFAIPGSVSQALLAEAAHEPAERKALVRKAALIIAVVMVPVLSVAYLAAPLGLELLGHRYAAEGLATLRLLIIAGAMSSMNYITGTVLYIAKKTFTIAAINTVDAIIVLGLAVFWTHDAHGVAAAWVVGEIANILLFAIFAGLALRRVHGRWEALGGDTATADGLLYGTRESQQAGLDALLWIAAQGLTGAPSQGLAGPMYPAGERPAKRSGGASSRTKDQP